MVEKLRFVKIGFLVGCLFIRSVSPADAHETSVHELITNYAIDYLIQKRPELKACGSEQVRNNLKRGVVEEDAFINPPLGNFLFHFNPRLNDDIKGIIHAEGSCDSITWGFDNGLCNGSLTNIQTSNGQTIQSINLYRYDFILSDLKNTRGPEKASAWVGLGHFLHLLQDLTSPAHTRVDAHPHVPFAPSIDDPSKLEVLGKIKAGPLPLPQEGLITSFTDAKSAFTELRNWVVSNFYSEKNTNVPNYTSPSGPIGTLGADGYVRNGQRKIAYFDFLQSFLLNRQIYTINDVIALEQFDELAVAAIRWTASMMNFIHEKEGADGKGVPICEEQLVVQTTGKGTVTSSPNGISCGTTCDYYFPAGRSVTLVAFPASSSDPFLEWTGDIDPAKCPPKQTTCVVEMNDDKPKNVVANFDSVQVASIGAGTHFIHYTQNGTSCGAPVDTSGDFTVFFGPITLRKSLKLEIRDNGWLPATVTEAGVTSWGLGSSTYTSSISAAGIVTTSESGGKSSEDGVNRTGSSTETIDLNTGEYTWFRTISASFGCTSFVETQDRKATLPVTLN